MAHVEKVVSNYTLYTEQKQREGKPPTNSGGIEVTACMEASHSEFDQSQSDTLAPLPPPTRRGILQTGRRRGFSSSSSSSTSDSEQPLLPVIVDDFPLSSPPNLGKRKLSKQVSITLPAVPSISESGQDLADANTEGIHKNGTESLKSSHSDEDIRPAAMDIGTDGDLQAGGQKLKRHKSKRLERLQSSLNLDALARNELELKANLYYHIGNPLKRWKVERVVPIKLLLQALKTFCLVVQVILFTLTIPHQRSEFFFKSREVFQKLFILERFESFQTSYSLYTIEDTLTQIEFTAIRYYRLPNLTIGGYDFERDGNGTVVPIRIVLRQYREAVLNASDDVYILDGRTDEITFPLLPPSEENVTEQLFSHSNDPYFHKFKEMVIQIPVRNIRIVHPALAECFLFHVEIGFTNKDDIGTIDFHLKETHEKQRCHGTVLTPTDNLPLLMGLTTTLDLIVLGMCSISIFLTFNSLRRALKLGRAMGSFYHNQLKLQLSWWDRRSIFSPWHLFNFISDCLIISGSIVKIFLEYNVIIDASAVRILLGTALLFQAGVMLRYISYFKQLNALTRTLMLAFPELLKFLLCAFILFISFALCGWIVLGPFHPRFGNLNSAIESLFGLLNGDDIYNNYTEISPLDDLAAYIYSRVFLYVFLALFIYAVLNLFTSLIISAYEESQKKDTATKNEVRRFVFSGPLTPHGTALRDVTLTKKYVDPELVMKRRRKEHESDDDDDYM